MFFDETISSSDYLEIARQAKGLPPDLHWMLEMDDFGIHERHVALLIDAAGWRQEAVRPCVFVEGRINQRGNLQMGWAGDGRMLVYDEDFVDRYIDAAQAPSSISDRSVGELLWLRDFSRLKAAAIHQQSSAATAILFGLQARIHQIYRLLADHLNFLGGMELAFGYDGRALSQVDLVPSIPETVLKAMISERGRRWRDRLKGRF